MLGDGNFDYHTISVDKIRHKKIRQYRKIVIRQNYEILEEWTRTAL